MATLTNDDLTFYKRELRKRPTLKTEMAALSPSKQTWLAVMQALEDGYNDRRLAIKGEMDTALGGTLTVALSKQLEDIWMARKASL